VARFVQFVGGSASAGATRVGVAVALGEGVAVGWGGDAVDEAHPTRNSASVVMQTNPAQFEVGCLKLCPVQVWLCVILPLPRTAL
jgi:hypothetical protein